MATKQTEIQIMEVQQGVIDFYLLGRTPLILRRMSQKALRDLLLPKGRKTAAEKRTTMKHDMLAEFRDSPYTLEGDDAPTLIAQLSSCFKQAMCGAALDIPGATKSSIGRLVWVEGELTPIYGVPKMHAAVVRSADMNRTPDVRTRCIVPEWACQITVRFARPVLNEKSIANLLAAAGMFQGVGDWRPQKGSGTYGSFDLVAHDDKRWHHIAKHGGRAVQLAAMETPDFHDRETADLYRWFVAEVAERGNQAMLDTGAAKANGNGHAKKKRGGRLADVEA